MTGTYYHTKESVEEYIKMASGINGQQLIDQLRMHLPSHSKVLELGSGPGSDWEILSKMYQVTGSDFSAQFLHHLTLKFPTGRFLELNASTLDVDESFDSIYSNKVLHHLSIEELKSSIVRQSRILHAGGIVCHSFWRGNGSETYNGLLVNYQNEQSLRILFHDGFTILSMQKYAEFEKDDSLLLLAQKKEG
jgi:ubiquinone/menaquinone biosynthesis C-methylase UbiE